MKIPSWWTGREECCVWIFSVLNSSMRVVGWFCVCVLLTFKAFSHRVSDVSISIIQTVLFCLVSFNCRIVFVVLQVCAIHLWLQVENSGATSDGIHLIICSHWIWIRSDFFHTQLFYSLNNFSNSMQLKGTHTHKIRKLLL